MSVMYWAPEGILCCELGKSSCQRVCPLEGFRSSCIGGNQTNEFCFIVGYFTIPEQVFLSHWQHHGVFLFDSTISEWHLSNFEKRLYTCHGAWVDVDRRFIITGHYYRTCSCNCSWSLHMK